MSQSAAHSTNPGRRRRQAAAGPTVNIPANRLWRYSTECECTRPKPLWQRACDHCLWLDGERGNHEVIAALQSCAGRATLDALVLESELSTRQVLRIIKRLLASGRIRKYFDLDDEPAAHGDKGPHGTAATYVLIDLPPPVAKCGPAAPMNDEQPSVGRAAA